MNLIPKLPGVELAWSAIPLAFLVYALLQYDARRKGDAAETDDQLGIKTVAATLVLVSTLMFALGLRDLLHVLLTFDEFWERFKGALPSVLVGGLGIAGTAFVLFPKTNAAEFPKAKRLAAGIVALVSGIALLPALAGFLSTLLDWPNWNLVALGVATVLDVLVVFGASFMVLGKLTGIEMSAPKPAQAPAQPQQAPAQPQVQQQPMAQAQPMQQQPMQQQPQQGYPQQQQQQQQVQQPQQGYPQQQGYPPAGQPGQPGQPGGWPQG